MKSEGKNYGLVIIISCVHFFISLIYRLFFYHYNDENMQYFNFPKHVRETALSGYEKQISMLLSAIMGALLIFVIWYILVKAFFERRKEIFFIVFAGIFLGVLFYPNCFGFETDTFEMYAYATRNIPNYWHSIYSTCIYNACLMVFPQPEIIPIIQICGLLGTLYYISLRSKKLFSNAISFLPWILLMMPSTFQIAVSTYRNCMNTIMCMAFFAVVFFDAVENRQRTERELIIMCFCSSFLTVFRSEQILMMFMFLAASYFVYRRSFKKVLSYLGIMMAICLLLLLPQKQGEYIYFGKDYSIINQLNTLAMILREKDVNLDYEEAGRDLEMISRIVPIQDLVQSGITGYREHVFSLYGTVNQSYKDLDVQNEFMKATRNIYMHNPDLFLKNRFQVFLDASGLKSNQEDFKPDENSVVFQSYAVNVYLGQVQMYEETLMPSLLLNKKKLNIVADLIDFCNLIDDKIGKMGIILMVRIMIYLVFAAVIVSIHKEKMMDNKIMFWFISIIVLYAQSGGIFLMCPEGRRVYYYPVTYVLLLGEFILLLYYRKKRSEVRN